MTDLDEAIVHFEKALSLMPTDDEDRNSTAIDTANALIGRVGSAAEQPGDLERLIELQRAIMNFPEYGNESKPRELLARSLIKSGNETQLQGVMASSNDIEDRQTSPSVRRGVPAAVRVPSLKYMYQVAFSLIVRQLD